MHFSRSPFIAFAVTAMIGSNSKPYIARISRMVSYPSFSGSMMSISTISTPVFDILKSNTGVEIVLMDIMLPEKDGYETMRDIRAMYGFELLPIIAVTAKAMKGDREKCIDAGASDYLSKPIDPERLLALLR